MKVERLLAALALALLTGPLALEAQDRGFKAAVTAAAGDEAAIGKQWAVFIAIDRYQEWGPLSNPVKDAKEIRDILSEGYFIDEIVELYDAGATAANIRRLFADLGKRTGVNDSVFVFYAGHGQTDTITQTGSWIPVDGGRDQMAQANWLPNIQVRNMLAALPAKHVFLIADACFSGDILDTSRGASPEISNEYYRRAYNRVSRQVMTSGASETVPDASEFALRLKSSLRRAEGLCIDPEYLFANVREVKSTQPLLGVIRGSEHQTGGSFLFFRRTEVSDPAGSPAPERPIPAAAAVPAAPPPETVPPGPAVPEDLVFVTGGSFMMGSPPDEPERRKDEFRHRVSLDSFYMGKREVTQREYQALMGVNPSRVKGDMFPVESVSWYDAVEYCNRRSVKEGLKPAYTVNGKTVVRDKNAKGYRLPTEAEWEYACRAGTASRYSQGGEISPAAAVFKRTQASPAGSLAPNPWGLRDMHGNAGEWCQDWYGEYSSRSETNPEGPGTGSKKVYRGGSWKNAAADIRSSSRGSYNPSNSSETIGFRVCRSP
ncbi:MAG: SUMF1/EgtB/PvdO family nonheme iron enzyme [Treponema sp.]|jgi:formylglycine-generating enzyme required for sulfatase activity|nr:SUMF1/EgtB/PvdO family nonheme iron enzyme [Treponema sp.]